MKDFPLCLNKPLQYSVRDENERALTHAGLPCVWLGGNNLNILQSLRFKKQRKY